MNRAFNGPDNNQKPGEAAARRWAVVVVDVLNRYEHPDADTLRGSMADIVPALSGLIKQAGQLGAHVVYVNDNYGDWSAGREQLCEHALAGVGAAIVEPLLPPRDAAFVTKARHTVFYETPLDYLLRGCGVDTLVLTGQVTEQCILYSALDGYVRHYSIVVPTDGVAHIHRHLADAALEMMRANMRAEITTASEALKDVSPEPARSADAEPGPRQPAPGTS